MSTKYRCQFCNKKKGKNGFSNNQFKKHKQERKCKKCVNSNVKSIGKKDGNCNKIDACKIDEKQQKEESIIKQKQIKIDTAKQKHSESNDDCSFCGDTGIASTNDDDDEQENCLKCYRGTINIFKMLKKMEIETLQKKQGAEIRKIRVSWDTLIRNTKKNKTFRNKQDEKSSDTECEVNDELFCGKCNIYDENIKRKRCEICDMLICEDCSNCCKAKDCDAFYCDKCQNEPFGLESMKCGAALCKSGCCGYHVRICQCRETVWW